MQGLPFDDSDFPPSSVPISGAWMDQSPRLLPNPAPTTPAAVTEEEIYHIVGTPQPSSAQPQPSNADVIQRFSQQMPAISSGPIALYSTSQAQTHLQQQQQQHFIHPQLSQRQHRQLPQHRQSNVSPIQQPPTLQGHQPPQINVRLKNTLSPKFSSGNKPRPQDAIGGPARHQRVSTSQGLLQQTDSGRRSRGRTMQNSVESDPLQSTNQQVRHHGSPPLVSNTTMLSHDEAMSTGRAPTFQHEAPVKATRSAVEEARLRAQREAESFANSRRDPTKRESGMTGSSTGNQSDGYAAEGNGDRRSSKRARYNSNLEQGNVNGSSSGKGLKGTPSNRSKVEDDSEAEKQERYKRRLDMNRESAAVSRVRRRAYVKELEERLATVEAEKLQLEGKLEIMQSQNDGFKKQLENLFMMVASGRRPQYPPPSQDSP